MVSTPAARVAGVAVHFLTGIVLIAEKGPSSAMEQQLSIRKTGLIACSAMEGPLLPKSYRFLSPGLEQCLSHISEFIVAPSFNCYSRARTVSLSLEMARSFSRNKRGDWTCVRSNRSGKYFAAVLACLGLLAACVPAVSQDDSSGNPPAGRVGSMGPGYAQLSRDDRGPFIHG